MDFTLAPEEMRFREDARQWLSKALPAGWGAVVREPADEDERAMFRLEWERKLFEGGWSGIAWPKAYGGRGASLIEQAIFSEELSRARAPEGLNIIGRNLVAPTLIAHGTEAQKKRFLPKILAAEEVWCQGFSEPGAGSDLASLKTRAVRDGDDFIINGQKIWTSFAQYASWCILLVRTDPEAQKHRGLSFLLVDMKSPGITRRPLVQITGDKEFNELFFDDVRVPVENLVGDLDQGWKIAMTTLRFERGPEDALARQIRFKQDVDRLLDTACGLIRNGKPAIDDPVIRQKIATAFVEVELMRLNCLRNFSKVLAGGEVGPEASLIKLYWSHMFQRITEIAMEMEGILAPLSEGDPLAPANGAFQYLFLHSRAYTIYSGSSEIQRNIIAERVLGLPKGARA